MLCAVPLHNNSLKVMNSCETQLLSKISCRALRIGTVVCSFCFFVTRIGKNVVGRLFLLKAGNPIAKGYQTVCSLSPIGKRPERGCLVVFSEQWYWFCHFFWLTLLESVTYSIFQKNLFDAFLRNWLWIQKQRPI